MVFSPLKLNKVDRGLSTVDNKNYLKYNINN